MRAAFITQLVNDPFGDPGLYVELRHERRGMLFDCGDLSPLSSKQIMRITDVFVSHAHMDHFIGFDRLLRLFMGRERHLRMVGPPGFIAQVGHKLAAYTWNLIESYATEFTIEVTEVHPHGQAQRCVFRSRHAFRAGSVQHLHIRDGQVRNEIRFQVRAALLDHRTPCLAFSLKERQHIGVRTACLEALGLPVGNWLRRLKAAARTRVPESTTLQVAWRDATGKQERSVSLRELAPCLVYSRGHHLAYVVDARYDDANARAIIDLAKGANTLFIEAAFLNVDADRAAARYHLTARQAGSLARQAGVKRVIPMHFSPRYEGEGERLVEEVQHAFMGGSGWTPPPDLR